MYGWPRSNDFRFAPNLIGEALAHIVSELEGEIYTYESLKVYEHGWRQGCGFYVNYFNAMAIVKEGFSKCSFCLNNDSPWIQARLADILNCTMHWASDVVDYERPVSFVNEFSSQNCPFSYLNNFLIILENVKNSNEDEVLTKEMVMELANDFIIKQTREKVKVNKKG